MRKPSMPVLWLQYFPLYHRVNIGPVLSICESRDSMQTKVRISLLCYFVAHVISTQHQRAGRPPPPTHRHRESLLPEKQRSVWCVVTFSTHSTRQRGWKQTHFVFTKNKTPLLLRCGLWCHRHGSSSPWPRGQWSSNSNIRRWAQYCSVDFALFSRPRILPLAQTWKCMYSSNITNIDQWGFPVGMYCAAEHRHYLRQWRSPRDINLIISRRKQAFDTVLNCLKLLPARIVQQLFHTGSCELLKQPDLWWCKPSSW